MKVKSCFGPDYKEYEIGDIVKLACDKPLNLICKEQLDNIEIAYQTYGKLNSDHSNAILICHALTGDQYVASYNPITQKKGWWDFMIGENKPIDTKKFFVICSNVIGGCMGSLGPKSLNPKTNQPYGINFPVITIQDMVNVQNLLIDHLGIKKLHAVIGGSTGGMQALAWSVLYPHKIKLVIPIATSYRHSPQNIAFHEVGRQGIMADKNWCNGNYLQEKKFPTNGLALARMTAHITYLSESALQRKFGRDLNNKNSFSFNFDREFQIENYLHHQGNKFVERFDPNSYLYITRAVDYFDLESDFSGNLSSAFRGFADNKEGKFCLISCSDDWLFPAQEIKKITKALSVHSINTSSVVISSDGGHDSFLIENDMLKNTISGFLNQN
ncbi:homoserine O-acetyltransferase [Alphaproteobacteria bacterium]|nr:homoserine O-acetyltransferase [Alphaproteobacteria bacterium]